MVASTYPEAIRRVLLSEGGYVNHPSDPGGPTNYGITLAVYRENGHAGATAADVKAMPLDEAKRIYKVRYANPVAFDQDPAGLDYTLFDYGVNSGPGRENKVVRRVCSLPDSAPLPDLLTALAKRDAKAVIGAVNAERLKFLQGLSTWPTFGKGWGARVQSVNAAALKIAAIGAAPVPSTLPPVPDSQGKGEVPKPNVTKPIVVGTGGGGTAAGASWWDWVAAHPMASVAIAVVVIGGTILLAEFIAHKWQAAKQDAPTPGLIPVPETKV